MNERTFEDAFNMLCGKFLGEGIHRKVFECKLRPDLVVKVEDNVSDYRNFANVKEHQFWSDYVDFPAVAKWLAPSLFLSPDGRISLQSRVERISDTHEMPKLMPHFLTDLKRSNFGWLDGKLVCVDYAWTLASAGARLRKAQWSD